RRENRRPVYRPLRAARANPEPNWLPLVAKADRSELINRKWYEMQRSIGELAAKTDRLIADVKTQGHKLDRLQHQASFIKGGLAASVFFITAIVAVAGWILITKWDALIQTINAMAK
ncbi:MAG: hypothetical protein WCC90_19200, partial [Methylocella sp.]